MHEIYFNTNLIQKFNYKNLFNMPKITTLFCLIQK